MRKLKLKHMESSSCGFCCTVELQGVERAYISWDDGGLMTVVGDTSYLTPEDILAILHKVVGLLHVSGFYAVRLSIVNDIFYKGIDFNDVVFAMVDPEDTSVIHLTYDATTNYNSKGTKVTVDRNVLVPTCTMDSIVFPKTLYYVSDGIELAPIEPMIPGSATELVTDTSTYARVKLYPSVSHALRAKLTEFLKTPGTDTDHTFNVYPVHGLEVESVTTPLWAIRQRLRSDAHVCLEYGAVCTVYVDQYTEYTVSTIDNDTYLSYQPFADIPETIHRHSPMFTCAKA